MECPFCTASVPEDDLFCEVCGKPVHSAVQPGGAETGCSCGAPPDEIDEDGYCGRCGKLARRPASDHIEMVLSPDFAGVSDRGLLHQRNEDRFAIRQVGAGYVLVVCDGVSSSRQSELASSTAAEHIANTLEASLRRHSASSPERSVRAAILDAQERLSAEETEGDWEGPPSTTVVAALVNGTDAAIGWAGDSRAYWIGEGETRQLTMDHSWVNDVVAAGAMTADEAANAPEAHGITRWLGADAGEYAEPEIIHFSFPGPGCLLLCTDGLWNYAAQPELPGTNAIDMARSLVDFANAQGGHDNITAVVLRVGGQASACEEPVNHAE